MNKFIYIHGWGSNGESGSAALFKTLIPDLITPSLDYYNPAAALETLLALVDDRAPTDNVYIIASSLGGFFAENIAIRRVVNVIFYNPSLRPYTVSRIDPAAMSGLRLLALPDSPPATSTRSIVLCTDDDVVLPEFAEEYFSEYDVRFSTGGHRMTERNAELIMSILNKKIYFVS